MISRSNAFIVQEKNSGWSFGSTFFFSILFHAVLLIGIPLILRATWKTATFQRPQTFQLVTPMRPVQPHKVQKQKAVKPTPSQKNKSKDVNPEPKKETASSTDDNIDELASILDELPVPTMVSAVGNFKFHWYINNVQQKLERFWNPPTENNSIKVVVRFIIYKDGSISEPSITKSSGSHAIDNMAIRAVKLAAPFGRLPPGFSGDKLDLNCTLIPTRK